MLIGKIKETILFCIELEKRMNGLEEDLSKFDKAGETMNCGYIVLGNTLINFTRNQEQNYPTITKFVDGVAS